MAITIEEFGARCHDILKAENNAAGRAKVLDVVREALKSPEFVARYIPDDCPERKIIYQDPELGFCILAHNYIGAKESAPHDHGPTWAIYGQATKYTDMTEWEREDDGSDPKHAKLKPVKKYRLNPGEAGIYQDGTIHSIDYPDYAKFVRVTGTNLDRITRIRVDLKTGEVHQMTPQQAT